MTGPSCPNSPRLRFRARSAHASGCNGSCPPRLYLTGVEVRRNYESSTTLLAQIQQGAPADVYASSAEEEMDKAVKDGLVAGDPKIFAKNREVIMVPEENPANIRSLRDLARPGVKLVLTQEGVPSTDYAVEILGKANARYGSGFKGDVLSNVVSREPNVRAAVDRVALGDSDATFSYASDYTPDIREREKRRSNGEGTIYKRKDGRYEACYTMYTVNGLSAGLSTARLAQRLLRSSPRQWPIGTKGSPLMLAS